MSAQAGLFSIKTAYSGVWADTAECDSFKHIMPPIHIKAHRSDQDIASLDFCERRLAKGNAYIDLQAKSARNLHPTCSEEWWRDLQVLQRQARFATLILGKTLAVSVNL